MGWVSDRKREIGEKELFAYIKKDSEAAQALYCALSGTDNVAAEKVKIRENVDTYFLVLDGGAIFAFSKQKEE